MKNLLQSVTFLFALTTAAFAQAPLYIGSAYEPPISSPGQRGMVDRIVHEAFARIGVEIEVTPLPAERSLINAAQGINAGDLIRIGGMYRHYPNLVPVPEKIVDFEFVAFTLDPQIEIDDWKDLASYNVGIVRGWKILENRIVCEGLTQVESLPLLFTLLEKGRVDVVIYERLAGVQAIQSSELEGVNTIEPPLEIQPMYLHLNNKHKGLTGPLVTAIKGMKNDGTYESIIYESLRPLIQGKRECSN